MPASFINEPQHWRNRAEEARKLADEMNDETSRQMMLQIAEDYERLAERAAQRDASAQIKPKPSAPGA
jgi:DNA-binding ferritin-like protein